MTKDLLPACKAMIRIVQSGSAFPPVPNDARDLLIWCVSEIDRLRSLGTAEVPIPMGRENPDDTHVVGYMCLVDFECEIGLASGGNRVYPSVEDIREHSKCVAGCGIVEVEVRAIRVVQQPSDEGDMTITGVELSALCSAASQPPVGGDGELENSEQEPAPQPPLSAPAPLPNQEDADSTPELGDDGVGIVPFDGKAEIMVRKSALDAAVAAERAKWEDEVAEIKNRLKAVEKIQGLVRAEEREACAKVVKGWLSAFQHKASDPKWAYAVDAADDLLDAIRSRSQSPEGGADVG